MAPEVIDRFDGTEYAFLSNFFVHRREYYVPSAEGSSPSWDGEVTPVRWLGVDYMTSEHAFQAAKATELKDHDWVAEAPNPSETKKRGRAITLRADWDSARDYIMYDILQAKFEEHHLRKKLLATAPAELIEGNTWHDNHFGDCRCGRTACAVPGENVLGKLLMKLRSELAIIGSSREQERQ